MPAALVFVYPEAEGDGLVYPEAEGDGSLVYPQYRSMCSSIAAPARVRLDDQNTLAKSRDLDEQGCSNPVSESNRRFLDRIAGLEKIIPPELIQRALAMTGKQTQRACTLSNEVRVQILLALGLFTDLPIRMVYQAWSSGRSPRRKRPVRSIAECVESPSLGCRNAIRAMQSSSTNGTQC